MGPALRHIVFEATTACNLDCMYCYNIWKRPGAGPVGKSTYRDSKRALKRVFKLTDVAHVSMSGGEPFLAERFLELVLFCRMKGKTVTVITNGNAAKQDDYQALVDMGVGLFEIPLHSPTPEIHDRMTGVKSSWQKALDSIRTLQEIGGKVVADIVLSKINAAVIGETLAFLQEAGVNQVMITRFNVGGRGIENRASLTPSQEELQKAFRVADGVASEQGMRITSNVCTPLCLVDPGDYPHIGIVGCSPDIERKPITLEPSGNLRICNHSPVVMGNIFKEPLEKILTSEYVKSWKTVPEFCSECDVFEKCFGGCRGAAEQLGLSLEHVDPVLTGTRR
jgi:radical SAM protein with 4Fe4S-binding SPASM domain